MGYVPGSQGARQPCATLQSLASGNTVKTGVTQSIASQFANFLPTSQVIPDPRNELRGRTAAALELYILSLY